MFDSFLYLLLSLGPNLGQLEELEWRVVDSIVKDLSLVPPELGKMYVATG